MIEQFPARLHVLLARDAKVGLIIRRGPSKQTATFLWDRKRDTVTLGQWLKGRIYERRSDLSPDGKHLIYFAMNGYWKSESKGSWTAVSRAPYLKALAFYPKGDCWNGGGLWTTQSTYWLNESYIEHKTGHESPVIKRDDQFFPQEHYGAECTGVYYLRLIRDGWRHLGQEGDADIFEKYVSKGWTLRKIAHAQINHPPGKGCYWDEHALEQFAPFFSMPHDACWGGY